MSHSDIQEIMVFENLTANTSKTQQKQTPLQAATYVFYSKIEKGPVFVEKHKGPLPRMPDTVDRVGGCCWIRDSRWISRCIGTQTGSDANFNRSSGTATRVDISGRFTVTIIQIS